MNIGTYFSWSFPHSQGVSKPRRRKAAHPPAPGRKEGEEGALAGAGEAAGPMAAPRPPRAHKTSYHRQNLAHSFGPRASLRTKIWQLLLF